MKIQNLSVLAISVILSSGCSSNLTVSNGSNSSSVSITSNKINDCAIEFGKVKLTSAANNTSFSTDIITPASFTHNYKVISIDASDFTSGGTINISGSVGTGTPPVSFVLLDASSEFNCSGFQQNILSSSANVKSGNSFNFNYKFSSGQTLRLGAEGSWGAEKDSKNNVNLNISIN